MSGSTNMYVSGGVQSKSKIMTFLPTIILVVMGILSISSCIGLYYRSNSSACKGQTGDTKQQCDASSSFSSSFLFSGCAMMALALLLGLKPMFNTIKNQ
jgi:hypothetical protein